MRNTVYTPKYMNTLSSLDDLIDRLLPLTYFRRNAGKVMAKLPMVGTFILTKDGKPVAKLSAVEPKFSKEKVEENLIKLRRLAGGFHLGKDLTPSKINKIIKKSYAKNLP